jgi:hypothetical protein
LSWQRYYYTSLLYHFQSHPFSDPI